MANSVGHVNPDWALCQAVLKEARDGANPSSIFLQ